MLGRTLGWKENRSRRVLVGTHTVEGRSNEPTESEELKHALRAVCVTLCEIAPSVRNVSTQVSSHHQDH
jgi:hypothetical protein